LRQKKKKFTLDSFHEEANRGWGNGYDHARFQILKTPTLPCDGFRAGTNLQLVPIEEMGSTHFFDK
jgi:hypothetical protein